MQQLHLVGFTTDLDGLIFSARRGAKSGGYLVALDDRFVALIKEAVRLQTGVDLDEEIEEENASQTGGRRRGRAARYLIQVDSALTPKEIQARLRAGRTVEEIASEAGVDEDWVMRFAAPVLAEQSRVIERAMTLPCRTPRKGESSQPLSVSVAWNLVDKGLRLTADELAAGWSAYHVRDTAWLVRFRYTSRNRVQVAQWECDPAEGTLIALNRLASELGYVEAGRRHRAPSMKEAIAATEVRPAMRLPEPPAAPARPVLLRQAAPTSTRSSRATKKSPTKKTTAKKSPAKKTAVKKTAKKTAARVVARRPPARTTSAARRAPAKKATAKKATAKRTTAKRTTAKKATAKRAPARKVARPPARPVARVRRSANASRSAGSARTPTKAASRRVASRPVRRTSAAPVPRVRPSTAWAAPAIARPQRPLNPRPAPRSAAPVNGASRPSAPPAPSAPSAPAAAARPPAARPPAARPPAARPPAA
ncbi:MAG TPA: septation protein SepH, partial [Acidimicrobiales bacterium]|nr:septation protein SepH [Acidimicrobiales bacterium]